MSNSTSLVSWKWSSEVTLWQPRIGAWKGVVSLWKSFTGADSVDLFSISGVLSWIVTAMHQIGTFNEYLQMLRMWTILKYMLKNIPAYFGGGVMKGLIGWSPSGRGIISRATFQKSASQGSITKSGPRSCWSSPRPKKLFANQTELCLLKFQSLSDLN